MQFAFTYAPGTTLEQMISFETAGRVWASHLTDNVTINIHVSLTDTLPGTSVGGALLGVEADQQYDVWRDRLAADRTSADDQLIHQNQSTNTEQFTALLNGTTQSGETLNLSRANAKAIGLRNGQDATLDGYILMTNQLSSLGLEWDYTLNGAAPSNSVDFYSVALHEIGHILGFYSGIDAAGWQVDGLGDDDDDDDNNDNDDGGGGGEVDPRGALQNATGLDMLRFSAESVAAGQIDLSEGGNPYFSIDGGQTSLALFATGTNVNAGGDGDQASHWKSQGGSLGLMEPDIQLAEQRMISSFDRRALDAIGWDLATGQYDLDVLQQQVKQALADRLGQTIEWLEANPETAAAQLSQDRTADVEEMITQSQIYDWRRSRRGTSSGYWQEVDLSGVTPAAGEPIAAVQTEPTQLQAIDSIETGWEVSSSGLSEGFADFDSLISGGLQAVSSVEVTENLLSVSQPDGFNSDPSIDRLSEFSFIGAIDTISATAIATLDSWQNYAIGSEFLQLAF